MTITVDSLLTLDDELLEECYALYAALFAEVNELAAQRHLMTRPEFSEVASDDRVHKLIARNGAEELVGIGAVTNVLAAHPLVSEPYYARQFPEHHKRGALWYVMFVGSRPRTPHVFRALVKDLYAYTTSNDGIALMDFCSYNEDVHRIEARTEQMLLGWDPNTRCFKVDSQTTWGYRFDTKEAP